MELATLEKHLLQDRQFLFMKLKEMKDCVIKAAESERAYRVALSQKMTEFRAEGTPITIMGDLCRGDKVIAKLKLDRDIARGMSDACRQSIISLQSSISGLQTLISSRKAEMQLI